MSPALTSSLTLLANAYRFICVLCVVQAGSGLAAIYLYGHSTDVGAMYLQLVPAIFGVMIAEKTYRLLQYISRTDTSVLSRVNTHYALLLNYAAICSPVSIMALYMVERKVIPAASVTCRATMFTSWQCIPLGINFVFPYVLAVTAFSASQFLRRRALAIHGSALVAVPPPVPRPWLWLDKDVPAWRAPHLAEFESPVSVEDGVAERHNTKLPALA